MYSCLLQLLHVHKYPLLVEIGFSPVKYKNIFNWLRNFLALIEMIKFVFIAVCFNDFFWKVHEDGDSATCSS